MRHTGSISFLIIVSFHFHQVDVSFTSVFLKMAAEIYISGAECNYMLRWGFQSERALTSGERRSPILKDVRAEYVVTLYFEIH